MREILFRAKRKEDGVWDEGYLSLYALNAQGNKTFDKYLIEHLDGKCVFIDPETIGQYTGVNDMDGKKIFEGDILLMTKKNKRGKVLYYQDDASFSIFMKNGYVLGLNVDDAKYYKVIGNIYDGESK